MVDLTLNSRGSMAHFKYRCEQGLSLNWLQIKFLQVIIIVNIDNLCKLVMCAITYYGSWHQMTYTNTRVSLQIAQHTNNDSWAYTINSFCGYRCHLKMIYISCTYKCLT